MGVLRSGWFIWLRRAVDEGLTGRLLDSGRGDAPMKRRCRRGRPTSTGMHDDDRAGEQQAVLVRFWPIE